MNNHTETAAAPSTLRLVLAICAGMTIFALPIALSPILIAELKTQFQIAGSVAGYAVSAQFAGMVVSGLVTAALLQRVQARHLAVGGALLAFCSEIASALLAGDFALLVAARACAGIGVGIVYASSLALVGSSGQPEKIFGLVTALSMLLLALLTALAGQLFSRFGIGAGLLLGAAVTLLLLPVLLLLPRVQRPPRRAAAAPLPLLGLGIAMAAGLLLAKTALGMGTSFSVVAAQLSGLSTATASAVLGSTMLTGLTGSLCAAFLQSRVRRNVALCAGLLGAAVGWTLLYRVAQPWAFVSAALLYTFFSAFYAAYMMGTASDLDRSGRWAAVVSPFTAAGIALGAPLGGYVIDSHRAAALGDTIVVTLLVALVVFVLVNRRLAALRPAPL